MAYIEAKNIHKTFGKGDAAVHALRGASLSVDKGEMVAVMGKSGSGKSTLLNILGGLMTMDEGELRVGGKKVDFRKKKYLLNYRRREVGFVVQYFALIDDMNVYKNVSLPLRYQGIPGAKIRQRTTKMLCNFVKADGVAQSFIDKKGGISAGDMVPDARMPVLKSLCRSGNEADAVRLSGSDIDIANDDIIAHSNLTFRPSYQIKNLFCAFSEDHSFFCQRDLAGAFCPADEKLFAQFFFQIFNLGGKRGLGKMQGLGRVYDTLLSCDSQKIIQDT